KTAFITGITGQDGSYLAEFLLEKGYHVFGLCKKNPSLPLKSEKKVTYIMGNLSDPISIQEAIHKSKPDEVYNLASQSYPGESLELAIETVRTNGLGADILFDVIRQVTPQCRIYQASSSEMFGGGQQTPQNENTPFNPTNPYAAAKLYAHHIAQIYRK